MSLKWIDQSLTERFRAEAREDIDQAAKSDARRRAERNLIANDRRYATGGRRHDDRQS